MAPFRQGVGKERDIHVIAVFVRTLIGESHNAVKVSVSGFLITIEKTFQRSAAAVPLYKDLRAFRQSRKVVGSGGIQYVVSVLDVAGVDERFYGIGDIPQTVNSVCVTELNIRKQVFLKCMSQSWQSRPLL